MFRPSNYQLLRKDSAPWGWVFEHGRDDRTVTPGNTIFMVEKVLHTSLRLRRNLMVAELLFEGS